MYLRTALITLISFVTLFFSLSSNAQNFEVMNVKREISEQGLPQICFKQFLVNNRRCYPLEKTDLTVQNPYPDEVYVTSIRIEEMGVQNANVAFTVQWRGKGPNSMLPEASGQLNVLAVKTNDGVEISDFSDNKMAEQFGRGPLFDRSRDVMAVHTRTKIWLEEVAKLALRALEDSKKDQLKLR